MEEANQGSGSDSLPEPHDGTMADDQNPLYRTRQEAIATTYILLCQERAIMAYYIFRPYITKNGVRYYAKDYGLRAFRIRIK